MYNRTRELIPTLDRFLAQIRRNRESRIILPITHSLPFLPVSLPLRGTALLVPGRGTPVTVSSREPFRSPEPPSVAEGLARAPAHRSRSRPRFFIRHFIFIIPPSPPPPRERDRARNEEEEEEEEEAATTRRPNPILIASTHRRRVCIPHDVRAATTV